MQGYEGVMFIALTGDVTATSDLTLTVKGNTANHADCTAPVNTEGYNSVHCWRLRTLTARPCG